MYKQLDAAAVAANKNLFVFELAQLTYVEYVHANGQTWTGDYDPITTVYDEFYGTIWDDGIPANIHDASNKYWHGARIHVGNSTTPNGNYYCGLAGAE